MCYTCVDLFLLLTLWIRTVTTHWFVFIISSTRWPRCLPVSWFLFRSPVLPFFLQHCSRCPVFSVEIIFYTREMGPIPAEVPLEFILNIYCLICFDQQNIVAYFWSKSALSTYLPDPKVNVLNNLLNNNHTWQWINAPLLLRFRYCTIRSISLLMYNTVISYTLCFRKNFRAVISDQMTSR